MICRPLRVLCALMLLALPMASGCDKDDGGDSGPKESEKVTKAKKFQKMACSCKGDCKEAKTLWNEVSHDYQGGTLDAEDKKTVGKHWSAGYKCLMDRGKL